MSATLPPPAALPLAPETALPARRIELAPCDPAAVEALRTALRCSRTLAQVLVRRGYGDPEAARAFLAADVRHPFDAFAGIETAVETILGHVRSGSRITIHGDYDVDGVTATAILLRALRQLGADVDWFLPSRVDDGYGLALATVEKLAARGTRLLITVDCAITAVEEVAAARAAGLDVVVTDHHQPRADGRLPDAPIVHPAICHYPCPDLCAGAVAYKLAQALHAASGGDPAAADEDLDLVALATVADLVPLKGENRALVRAGLRALASTGKPGLRALMKISRVDPSGLDASAVGFRLAPRINAAGRLYRADAGVELLLTEDADRAARIADELDHANAERRLTEQRILWEAEQQVRDLGERPAYVLAGEGWHPGVIGIVASRVVERTGRPALLIALDPESGSGTGSGRSIPRFDLLGALHACAPLLERYGGHRAAAGVTIEAAQVEPLREAFEAHAAVTLTAEDLIPLERVDAVVGGRQLGLPLADELARLQPCGIGNPAVNLLVPGAEFDELRTMGQEGRHARFSVSAGGARFRAVAFGCEGRLPVPEHVPADATFRLERNEWNGAVEPRLLLRHATEAMPQPIRVLGDSPAETSAWLADCLAESDRLRAHRGAELLADPPSPAAYGLVADRRGEGGLALLYDLVAGGAEVVALCADVPRRLEGLAARAGGFALCSHAALERDPTLGEGFDHVVVLDPPASRLQDARMRAAGRADGQSWTHLTWGDAELRFAQQIHESEYGIRAALVPLYRALRDRGGVAGEELGRLLRGDGHGRSVHVAARLVAILEELELVSLDRDLPALTVVSGERTELDRSPTFRAANARYEDGQRFLLETATTPTDAPPA